MHHYMKSVRIQSFSGLYIPAYELNTERYSVSVRSQSEYGKIRTLFTQCIWMAQTILPQKIHVFYQKLTTIHWVHLTSHLLVILPMNKWSSKSSLCYWLFSIPPGHFRKRFAFWCFQVVLERDQLHKIY